MLSSDRLKVFVAPFPHSFSAFARQRLLLFFAAAVMTIAAFAAGEGWMRWVLAVSSLGVVVWALMKGAKTTPIEPGKAESPPPPTAKGAVLSDLYPFLEALPDAALLVDREGRIAGSNTEARRQLQFEASGLRLSSILRQPDVLDAAEAAALEGATRAVEYNTGGQVEEHFRVYIAPIAWGESSAALLIFHDQTARIMSERLRADFLANASHELKTPVAALAMMIETLSGPARDDIDVRDRFFGLMQMQVQRMRRLIEDLLSLSKIELDEHVPPSERSDLAAVVGEAADALAPIARDRGVTLNLLGAEGEAYVIGDRFQLAQVVQNLIDNAIKYSPSGGEITIEIGDANSREEAAERCGRRWSEAGRIALLTPPPSAQARSYAFVRVADQGQGIARRHLPRLSERFYRVERETSADKSGTGLGLAIVRHIISRHRGGFVVESEPGRGAAFGVYLTRAQAPQSRAAE
jgi:two-component system phosphate regulon sensor histidine kinase PhoR